MDDGLRYSFVVWFGDEQTTVHWTADMNAGRNTDPPSWAHFVEEAIVDAFSLPRGSKLMLTYADKDGIQAQLARDTPYQNFWDSLPRTAHHAATGKHGRLDVRRVEVERAEPAMCQISLGSRTRLFWCSLDDGAWDDIQLGVAQAFGLSKGSRVVFSVIDDEEDEITITDSFSWKLLLSILAIAPQTGKPVRIYITSVNGSAASPLDSEGSAGGIQAPIGDPRTLIPLPYLGASKVRFFVGQTRANFWFRNVHTDPDAWLVNWKVLWARASTILGRPTGSNASTLPEMFTFDHRGRLVTLTTPLCWKTYSSILNTYEKPFNKIEMHIKPPGATAIAPPPAPPAAGQKGSRFQIRAVSPEAPVLCFVHQQSLHIAVWGRRSGVSADETPAQAWTRAQAHVRELFKVPALEPYMLSYVDARHEGQQIASAEQWAAFVAFARADVNKIRIVSLAQQGEAVTATSRPPAPSAEVPRVGSPTPSSNASSGFAMRRAVRVSIVGSSRGSSRSIAFDPPPAYPMGQNGFHASALPVRSPPPQRSPPPVPLSNPPSSPLPPIPIITAPSLPPIPFSAPISPLMSTPTTASSRSSAEAARISQLERDLADARDEIARLRDGRDRSAQTIMHLTGEISRLVQENAVMQRARETGPGLHSRSGTPTMVAQ
ncbi:hypothetical protein BKA62DRAFT_616336 [Auriculariales sp. MPI-PUGE-AT-0066]|nr:hypothetical protein BKA62DRAFT_616336 [Auriculariales sp. MPI-PUGE-AT-0066]